MTELTCENCAAVLVPSATVRASWEEAAAAGFPVICPECEPFMLWRTDVLERRQKAEAALRGDAA